MIHDFCGGLEEEIMRNNFILVYELIDELIVIIYPFLSSYLGLWTPIDYSFGNFEEIC